MANPSPGVLPTFDSTAVNQTATSAGHMTAGFAASAIPSSQEFNYLFYLYFVWIRWLAEPQYASLLQIAGPIPTGVSLDSHFNWSFGTTASSASFYLTVPTGFKLAALTVSGIASTGTPTATLSLAKLSSTAGVASSGIGAKTSTLSTAASDVVLNLALVSSGLTTTVAVSGGNVTYTRSTGSFITDGFVIGQTVAWTGFTNTGNNQTITITGLSGTVMTAVQGTAVAETGAAAGSTVTGVPPLTDGTFSFLITITCTPSSGTAAFGLLRYTLAPF